jgi:hypothetical protein
MAGERKVLFVFGKNAVSGRENLVPGPMKQAKAGLRRGRLVRARRITYSRFHDGHDFAGKTTSRRN